MPACTSCGRSSSDPRSDHVRRCVRRLRYHPNDLGSDWAAWTDKVGALEEADGFDWANPTGEVLYCSKCSDKREVNTDAE